MITEEVLSKLTHTCIYLGGKFTPSFCDRRKDPVARRRLLANRPELVFELAQCARCPGPVPVDSVPAVKSRVQAPSEPAVEPVTPEPAGLTVKCRCRVCGTSNPDEFYIGQYHICKKCHRAYMKALKERRRIEGPKPRQLRPVLPHKCIHCGDENPRHFYPGHKRVCKACRKERMREAKGRGFR